MDILQVSGARKPQDGLAAAPPDSRVAPIAPAEVVAPYSYTAKVMGYLAGRLEEATMPLQEAAGAEAVTMDADGNVQVNRRWGEFTAGDRAYNHAAQTAGLAMARTKVSTDLTKLRIEYDGRPDEFQKAADAYVRTVGKGGDALIRPLIQQEAGSVAGQLARGLMVDKEQTDLRRFAGDLKAREDYLTEQLESLAEQSGTGTPEFSAKLQELVDLRGQKATNPKFAYSNEQASIDNARTGEDMKALSIVGEYRRKYLQSGDLAGTLKEAEERLNSSDLNLTPEQRSKYLGAITARTSAAAAVRQEMIRQTNDQADLLITSLNSEGKVDARTIDDTISTLRQYKQYAKIKDLEVARKVNELAPVLRYGTAVEKASVVAGLQKQAAVGATDRESYYRAIKGAESAGDPNAKNPASSATGLFQFTKGTWDQIRTDHPELGLTAAGRTDPDEQWRAIRVFTDENEARLRSINAEPTAQNLYTAHFLGGGGAVRFINGLRTNPDAPAANYVDKDAVAANPTIFYADGGKGRARTAQEVYAILGEKVGGAGGGVVGEGPIYAAAVKQLQAKFNAEVETAWTKVKQAWDGGQQPTPDEIQNVVALAPLISDPNKRKEIAERFEREAALERVDNASVVQVRAAVDELNRAAERGELGPAQRALADGLAKREEILSKKLKDDPLSLAGTGPLRGEMATGVRESIGPLRFDSPEMLGAQFQQRAIVARTVSAFHQEPLGSVLRPDDVPQVRQILQSGDAGAVASFFGAVGGLDDDTLFATVRDPKLKSLIDGLPNTTDQGKFNAAMSGLDQIYRRNPALFADTFGKETIARLAAWEQRLFDSPESQAKWLERTRALPSSTRSALINEAADFAKKKGVADIMKELRGYTEFGDRSPGDPDSRVAFMDEYREHVKDAYLETQDLEAAHKAAVRMMGASWQTSPTNGGRLMRNAPEKYYPTVDRSHDWMGKQVRETLAARLGLKPTMVGGKGGAVEVPPAVPAYTLVATPDTQADISAGRQPRYQVVYTNPTTGRLESFDARFNVDQAMAPVRARGEAIRAREEKRRPLVEGARREIERLNAPLDELNRQREEPLQ